MRQYLNGEFLSSFSASDRGRIAQVTNINSDNPWDITDNRRLNRDPIEVNTQDRIFLLSIEEVAKYFGDSGELDYGSYTRSGSMNIGWAVYDRYNDAREALCIDSCISDAFHFDSNLGRYSHWWLRSPHDTPLVYVDSDGGVMFGASLDHSFGVRPALWLDLES